MNPYENSWHERLSMQIDCDCKMGQNITLGIGVIIEHDCILADNVLIDHYSILRPGVIIGNNTEIRQFCFLAEGVKVGNQVKIFQFSNIGKGSTIEDCVYLGAGVILTNTRKIAHLRNYPANIEPVTVRYGARIGSRALILPGVTIGRNSLVGAGAIVSKDVPDNTVVMGRPAAIVREVPKGERLE